MANPFDVGASRALESARSSRPNTLLSRLALPIGIALIGAGAVALILAGPFADPAPVMSAEAAPPLTEKNTVAARSFALATANANELPAPAFEANVSRDEPSPEARTISRPDWETTGNAAGIEANTEKAPLPQDDARWARAIEVAEADPSIGDERPTMAEALATAALRPKLVHLQDDAPSDGAVSAASVSAEADFSAAMSSPDEETVASGEATDAVITGTIPQQEMPPSLAPTPEPAEEVAAIDAEAQSQPEPATPAVAVRRAKITTHVNLRAGPDNGAAVLAVVPAGVAVDVIGCNYWCEIRYEGRTGFVFKTFLGSGAKKAAAKKPVANKSAAKKSPGVKRAAAKRAAPAITASAEPAAEEQDAASGWRCGVREQCATFTSESASATKAAPEAAAGKLATVTVTGSAAATQPVTKLENAFTDDTWR